MDITEKLPIITKALKVSEDKIVNITVLKKGMTNRSFLFECNDKKYIMRIPGEGTDCLINRKEEADVYSKIASLKLCDEIIYINPENGYKITEYIEGARVCDPENDEDLKKCMAKLKSFHNLNLQVEHEFNIFDQIDFYESLWGGKKSVYKDYEKTKKRVLSLKSFIEQNIECKTLTHIDAVPDNFLFYKDDYGNEHIRLIDWEYAGMQDPHVDIAMFCIYSHYNKNQIDNLINIYFDGNAEPKIVAKIYCYVAVCGLLWSNWCEYKHKLGVDFGEYALRQYQYAKEFYEIALQKINEIN